MAHVGKRKFLQKASHYLKEVEETGFILTITHHNQPTLQLVAIKPKTIKDLAGTIKECSFPKNINRPVMEGFEEWFS